MRRLPPRVLRGAYYRARGEGEFTSSSFSPLVFPPSHTDLSPSFSLARDAHAFYVRRRGAHGEARAMS